MLRKSSPFLIAAALMICAAIFTTCRKARTTDVNVLVITLDTTRPDALGIHGNTKPSQTPNLDRLAREGVFFKQGFAPVPLTLPSHCSLFTGRYPPAHGVRNNGTYVLSGEESTMAEIFRQHGYRTSAVIASFTLAGKFGLRQGFDVYEESLDNQKMIRSFSAEIPADRVYAEFERLMETNREHPFFTWVHFYDPHHPYLEHPEAGRPEARSSRDRYDDEVHFMDEYIGRMLTNLEKAGLMDDTLIVVAGDHGEAFGEHLEFGHGIFCYQESLHVPLILHAPKHLETREIETPVNLVDVMPTVLALMGWDIPKQVQGRNLLPMIRGRRSSAPYPHYLESLFGKEENNWAPLTGLREGSYKYIALPEPELYDLEKDPTESNNLAASMSGRAREMDKQLERFVEDLSAPSPDSSRRRLEEQDIEKLKALGYISSFSNRSRSEIDPKQGIVLYSKLESLKAAVNTRPAEVIEKELERIQADNPQINLPSIYDIRYRIARARGGRDESVSVLEAALSVFPEHEEFKFRLAREHHAAGDRETSTGLCRELLERNPRFTAAHTLLGDIAEEEGLFEKAAAHYERAREIEPQNYPLKARYALLQLLSEDSQDSPALLEELIHDRNFTENPAYVDTIIDLSRQLAVFGKIDKSRELLAAALEQNPDNAGLLVNMGTIHLNGGDIISANRLYEQALDSNPDFPLAESNIGSVLFIRFIQEEDPLLRDQALARFNRALELDPSLAEAYNGRASVYFALNRVRDAVRDYEKSLTLNPDLLDAYFNLSLVLTQMGERARARDVLTRCRERFGSRLSGQDRMQLDQLLSDLDG